MANKKSARTNKHKPTFLDRSVSFGEQRDGAMRITRPGTSPTSPPHRRYPVTSPVSNRWAQSRTSEQGEVASKHRARPTASLSQANRRCPDHYRLPSIELPTIGASPLDAEAQFSNVHLKTSAPLGTLTSALVVTLVRRVNGDIEFHDGTSWHKMPKKTEKRMQHDGSVVLSSPTGGFKTLPALLQIGNLEHAPNSKDFKFVNTHGWERAFKEDTDEGEHIETWVYLGWGSPSPDALPAEKQKNQHNSTQPHLTPWLGDDPSVLDAWSNDDYRVVSHSDVLISQSPEWHSITGKPRDAAPGKSLMSCGRTPRRTKTPKSPTAKVTKSTTKKAKKNRKAREKKAHAKQNVGKREKLPYIPRPALKEKTLTRSGAKLHHVHEKQFYALP